MRNKGIGILLVVVFFILGFSLGLVNVDSNSDVDFWKSKSDSLFLVLKVQDSLISDLNKKQDSLLSVKNDSIIKIKEVYVSEIDFINNLDINSNVKLLSRNLSEDSTLR